MGVDPVAADANTEYKASSDPTQTENQELPQVLHVRRKHEEPDGNETSEEPNSHVTDSICSEHVQL